MNSGSIERALVALRDACLPVVDTINSEPVEVLIAEAKAELARFRARLGGGDMPKVASWYGGMDGKRRMVVRIGPVHGCPHIAFVTTDRTAGRVSIYEWRKWCKSEALKGRLEDIPEEFR